VASSRTIDVITAVTTESITFCVVTPRSLKEPDVSEEHTTSILQSLTHVYADFLSALFFDPEDEGGVPPKHQALSQLHGVTTHKTILAESTCLFQ
jgi:hypothetical protein